MNIRVDFEEKDSVMQVMFNQESTNINADFGEVQRIISSDMDRYEGPYEVTPTVEGQTLETEMKFMTEDVSIKAIPYFDVSNPAGGSTIYIAKEIE